MSWSIYDFGSAPGYQQAFDYAGTTVGTPIYIGWAVPGVATSDAKWKIRKFSYDGNNQILSIKWANGDVGFNSIWDSRASITYK